jgi:hypothetical protein
MWLLLSIFLMTDERDSCTFSTLSGYVGHKLHYIKVLQPPYNWTEKTEYQHTDSGIPDTQSMWLLLNNLSLIYIKETHVFFLHLLDMLAINYTTLKYCNFPRSGLRKTEYQHTDSGIPDT